MTTFIHSKKESKFIESLIEKYFGEKLLEVPKNIPQTKESPTIYSFKHLLGQHGYTVSQLKEFAKQYQLQVTGNKQQLSRRLYAYLFMSSSAIKIQTIFRGKMARQYSVLHGPATRNRRLCTNADDFISMEPVEDIHYCQFISYEDADGFIYGFDIASLHNLFQRGGKEVRNPYNRNLFPEDVIKDTMKLIRLGRLLNVSMQLGFEDASENVTKEKTLEFRVLTLFQNIDALGNYSNANWFLSLNQNQTIRFLRDLVDIWNYRAQLPQQTKRYICPPFGDPFRHFPATNLFTETDLVKIKTLVLSVMEKMVNTGIDKDSKSLGAYYVLGALTLVNEEAAMALPWLFQSMNYF